MIADENSSVHLPVLKLGIPSIAVRQLGRYPETRTDMYGLVRDRIVPPAVASIRDMQPDALAAFFSNGWAARFQRYDAFVRAAEGRDRNRGAGPLNLDLLMAAFPGLFAACWLLASSHERAVAALVLMVALHTLFWTNLGSTLLHRVWITAPS